ncbi:2OG-Fe(II) oxygenase [Hahella ganghwensis]|uniref:2OG-Fe(II) oxygenase n=1 Tax=Hahella ganghwensis TaxID=286420 RepID=UPI0003700A3F|nr:2OG-Fe(II) oxygenase [Hahella ganghwensis]
MTLRSFIEEAADHLSRVGWWVADDWLPSELSAALLEDARHRFNEGDFQQAKIGRGSQKTLETSIRADVTHWLTGHNHAQAQFMGVIEELRQGLNRTLFLGLQRFEAHYALYQPGAFYKRHIDNFDGSSPRMVTFTYYLNTGWRANQGGALRMYTGSQREDAEVVPVVSEQLDCQDILPEAGRLVLFMSQVFPHEVLPTNRDRWSIAGWLRTDSSDPLIAVIEN